MLTLEQIGIENFHSYNIKGSLFEREEDFKVSLNRILASAAAFDSDLSLETIVMNASLNSLSLTLELPHLPLSPGL